MSIFTKYARTWADGQPGFGANSYNDAIAAGFTPEEIYRDVDQKRVGPRGRDMIDAAKAAYASGESYGRDEESKDYQNKLADKDKEISTRDGQIKTYKDQISDYKTSTADLTKKYNNALTQSNTYKGERDDYMQKYTDQTALYETEKANANRYREEAVGAQLQRVRAGSTPSAGAQTDQMRGSLASGRTGYTSDARDISALADSTSSQGGLTDSVLSRQGPVVQQLFGGLRGGSAGGQRQATNSAGTGSYYASRFR